VIGQRERTRESEITSQCDGTDVSVTKDRFGTVLGATGSSEKGANETLSSKKKRGIELLGPLYSRE
jgi:hypothetical protein